MSNSSFFNEGLHLLKDVSDNAPIVAGPTAVCHRLEQGPQLAAYLIAQRQPDTPAVHQARVRLVDQIAAAFNLNELQDLCLYLHIDHEEISGETGRAQARELVAYVQRRNRLPELVAQCTALRPHQSWEAWAPLHELSIVRKPDLAVVVNLASRFVHTMPGDVAAYLHSKTSIDANFLLLQNPNEKKDIVWDGQWDQFALTFAHARGKAQQLTGANRAHFFLSGPGPILFSFGCRWGDVKPATVYHHIKGDYRPVIEISRE